MPSINGMINPQGILRHLGTNLRSQSGAMEKLSSGLRINKAADDPSGLALSEKLRAQINGLEQAIHNSEDADSVLAVMDGALGTVQSVLTNMRSLAVSAANDGVINSDRTAALQAEMDSSLQSISRIMETTNVAGQKLLGELRDEGKLSLGRIRREAEENDSGAENELPPGETLEEELAKLTEKDRALYNVGDKLETLDMASLGGIALPGNSLLRQETLTLEDLYSGGKASLGKDPGLAMRIVEQAGRDISMRRAEIGATISLRGNERAAMAARLENLTAMESGLRDTDFAKAVTEHARAQLLSQTGFRMLDAVMEQNKSLLQLFA